MDDAAEGRGYGNTTFQARVSASISRSPLGGRCYSFRRFGAFQAPRTLSGHPLPVLETGTPVDLARVGEERQARWVCGNRSDSSEWRTCGHNAPRKISLGLSQRSAAKAWTSP